MRKIIITLLSLVTILPQAFAAEEEFHTGLQVDSVWMDGTPIMEHIMAVHITFSNPNDTIAYSKDGIRIYAKKYGKILSSDLNAAVEDISVEPHSTKEITLYAYPLFVDATWIIGTGYWYDEETNEQVHNNPREIFYEVTPLIERFRPCDVSVDITISNSYEKDGKLCTNDNDMFFLYEVINNEDFTFFPKNAIFCSLEDKTGENIIYRWSIMPRDLSAGEYFKDYEEKILEYGKEYRLRVLYPRLEYCVEFTDPIYFSVVDPAVNAINSIASPDVPVTVYTTDGKLVMRGMMENTDALPKGIYIFKQEEKVWKVNK